MEKGSQKKGFYSYVRICGLLEYEVTKERKGLKQKTGAIIRGRFVCDTVDDFCGDS